MIKARDFVHYNSKMCLKSLIQLYLMACMIPNLEVSKAKYISKYYIETISQLYLKLSNFV